MTDRSPAARREAGFALLLVLWVTGFLALMVSQVLFSGRVALSSGEQALLEARLETEADAAITSELFGIVVSGHAATAVRPAWHQGPEQDGTLMVRSFAGRGVNPALANSAVLKKLFQRHGITEEKAEELSAAILAWRSPETARSPGEGRCQPQGGPFRTMDDLALVPGLTAPLLRRIAPDISFARMQPSDEREDSRPGPRQRSEDDEDFLVIVEAVIRSGHGAMLRHAEVTLLPGARPVPWRVMRWGTGGLPE